MASSEISSGTDARHLGSKATNALLRLGMKHAVDTTTSEDRIEAHKWFNIAAMRGDENAARLRREIAGEMLPAEIALAQRAAREWITLR